MYISSTWHSYPNGETVITSVCIPNGTKIDISLDQESGHFLWSQLHILYMYVHVHVHIQCMAVDKPVLGDAETPPPPSPQIFDIVHVCWRPDYLHILGILLLSQVMFMNTLMEIDDIHTMHVRRLHPHTLHMQLHTECAGSNELDLLQSITPQTGKVVYSHAVYMYMWSCVKYYHPHLDTKFPMGVDNRELGSTLF